MKIEDDPIKQKKDMKDQMVQYQSMLAAVAVGWRKGWESVLSGVCETLETAEDIDTTEV